MEMINTNVRTMVELKLSQFIHVRNICFKTQECIFQTLSEQIAIVL